MPYVLVRNTFNPALEQPFRETCTYIDFHQVSWDRGDDGLPDLVQALGGNLVGGRNSPPPHRTAKMHDPTYAVLNKLEEQGYTVVAVNTVKETTIWTLRYPRA
ncbi:hypothetical protein OS493_020384 [Desmophyllum pertusum]|uniref:GTP cyclohydrolase 1 feedback regulatory protein n=1 Tax=Desmophyllum pertusum TaxID=174260 RepID=A0A9X0D2H3_9CNID|nr:hypothetical protein OS493_020384 [Desmophyllum pertusum]